MAFNSSTFDLRQQNRHIRRHGDYVDWFPARKCSCTLETDSNRSNPTCRACKGLGYIYRESKRILGLVTGIANQKMLLEAELAQPGDLVFSQRMMEPHPISDFDMIRLTQQGWPYEGDLIVRSPEASDFLIYSATKVVDILQMDSLTGTITEYVQGTDYTHVSGSDEIVWVDNKPQPSAGSVYSVKYEALFDWVAFTAPAQRFERGTPLGNRVFLRKKHILLSKEQ